MNEINIPNLRLFVGALREVVDTLPEAEVVNLQSISPPTCGTPGCHAGLAMLALDLLGVPDHSRGGRYCYEDQATRLSDYLIPEMPSFDGNLTTLQLWSEANPDVWDGECGSGMFSSARAFGQPSAEFPSTVIVDKWAAVLDRLEKKS